MRREKQRLKQERVCRKIGKPVTYNQRPCRWSTETTSNSSRQGSVAKLEAYDKNGNCIERRGGADDKT
jgi:hypothetical protein